MPRIKARASPYRVLAEVFALRLSLLIFRYRALLSLLPSVDLGLTLHIAGRLGNRQRVEASRF